MINWFTYGGPADMSQQAAFIMAQVLAVLIGFCAFGATMYGLVKFYTREEYNMADELKPIGFKPDGSHINKGAIFVIALVVIGVYCIFADNPFSWLFGQYGTVIEVVK